MGSATSNGKTVHVTSVKFSAEEHAALKQIAEHDRRSLSNEIRWLVAQRAKDIAAAAALEPAA